MITRITSVICGLLGLCAPAFAQQATALPRSFDDTISFSQLRSTGAVDTTPALTLLRSDISSAANGSALIHGLPTLTLLDGRRLADSSAMQMGLASLDLVPLPFLQAVQVDKVGAIPRYGADATGGVVNLQLNRNYSGAEVGVYYGHSVGRSDFDALQTYILGGVGNDKTQVTGGISYDHFSGRTPR
jgi:outer membrane receptor protein involved in Fe transport